MEQKKVTTKPKTKALNKALVKHSADIREVSKDIIGLKFKKTDTLKDCMSKFFAVMKKHGIKQGTPSFNDEGKEVGRTCDNFEWTICKQMFIRQVESFFELDMLFGNIPKELLK